MDYSLSIVALQFFLFFQNLPWFSILSVQWDLQQGELTQSGHETKNWQSSPGNHLSKPNISEILLNPNVGKKNPKFSNIEFLDLPRSSSVFLDLPRSVFLDFPRSSSVFLDFFFSSIFLDLPRSFPRSFPRSSSIFLDLPRFSSIFLDLLDFPRSSSIFLDLPRSSSIFLDFPRSSSIFLGLLGVSFCEAMGYPLHM